MKKYFFSMSVMGNHSGRAVISADGIMESENAETAHMTLHEFARKQMEEKGHPDPTKFTIRVVALNHIS